MIAKASKALDFVLMQGEFGNPSPRERKLRIVALWACALLLLVWRLAAG